MERMPSRQVPGSQPVQSPQASIESYQPGVTLPAKKEVLQQQAIQVSEYLQILEEGVYLARIIMMLS